MSLHQAFGRTLSPCRWATWGQSIAAGRLTSFASATGHGARVWDKFNGGRDGTLWHYSTIMAEDQRLEVSLPLVEELARTVEDDTHARQLVAQQGVWSLRSLSLIHNSKVPLTWFYLQPFYHSLATVSPALSASMKKVGCVKYSEHTVRICSWHTVRFEDSTHPTC